MRPFLGLIQSVIKAGLNYKINFCGRNFFVWKIEQYLKYTDLNHFLIETKKFIFYDLRNSETFDAELMFERFKSKVKYIIIREKAIAQKNGKYNTFCEKWKNFAPIYNFTALILSNLI